MKDKNYLSVFMKVILEQIIISNIYRIYSIKFWTPKIKNYRYCIRYEFYLINLVKVQKILHYRIEFMIVFRSEGKNILLIPNFINPKKLVIVRANISQLFFVKKQWFGGILTNWRIIQQSLLTLY